MADKEISSLPAASNITDADLFVLQQSGTAKSLTGELLRQYAHDIESASINALGHLILTLKGGETVDAGTLPAGPGTGDMLASIYDAAQGRKQVAFEADLDTVRRSLETAVMFTAQSGKTDAQKSQARSNIGAAPSGFGYGETLPFIGGENITDDAFIAALDAVFLAMPFHTVQQVRIQDHPTLDGGTHFAQLWRANETYGELIAYSYFSYSVAPIVRAKVAGNWLPWEYITPPMQNGVEYRTTERAAGKPVYVKRVAYTLAAAVSNANLAITHGITGFSSLVRVEGSDSPYPIPRLESGGGFVGVTYVNETIIRVAVYNTTIVAGRTLAITVYYTKTT